MLQETFKCAVYNTIACFRGRSVADPGSDLRGAWTLSTGGGGGENQ